MVAGRMTKSLVANLEQIYIQKIIRSKFFCRKMQKNFFCRKNRISAHFDDAFVEKNTYLCKLESTNLYTI